MSCRQVSRSPMGRRHVLVRVLLWCGQARKIRVQNQRAAQALWYWVSSPFILLKLDDRKARATYHSLPFQALSFESIPMSFTSTIRIFMMCYTPVLRNDETNGSGVPKCLAFLQTPGQPFRMIIIACDRRHCFPSFPKDQWISLSQWFSPLSMLYAWI